MEKAPTMVSTGTCHPTTASPRHHSWELDLWVSACSCLAGPQGRGHVALAGLWWGEHWDSIAVPCAGPPPGVRQAVVQGGGTQRIPSVPAVLCVWIFFPGLWWHPEAAAGVDACQDGLSVLLGDGN